MHGILTKYLRYIINQAHAAHIIYIKHISEKIATVAQDAEQKEKGRSSWRQIEKVNMRSVKLRPIRVDHVIWKAGYTVHVEEFTGNIFDNNRVLLQHEPAVTVSAHQ
jgi:hypothetical protein